jgi:hypothetical protein
MKPKRKKKTGAYKRKNKLRPVIKITSDHISLLSCILDAAILFLLAAWWLWEIGGTH